MKIYEFEVIAAMALFGILWAVIPWDPLTVSEAMMAGLSMLVFCFGCVALVEHVVITIFEKVKGARRW